MADPKLFYDSKTVRPNEKVIVFDGLYKALDFINAVQPNLTGTPQSVYDNLIDPTAIQRKANDVSWYGTTDSSQVTGQLNRFLFTNELDTFLNSLRSQTVRTDVRDIDQKKKMTFTELEMGVFSFDLASLGLVRVFEYYSPLLQTIVDSNLVTSFKAPSGDLLFFFKGVEGYPTHEVFYNGKGYWESKLLGRPVNFDDVFVGSDGKDYIKGVDGIPKHEVERRQKKNNRGLPMFSSTWKKSFIYFPKSNKRLPRIDLIINAAYYSSVNAVNQMIWGTMAGITIAEKLQNSGVNFRMFIADVDEWSNRQTLYKFIKIKDEDEPLNANGLAIASADARFYRNTMFRLSVTSAFELGWGNNITSAISGTLNDTTRIKRAFIDYLKQSQDFDDADSIVEDAKIVFRTDLNEQSARNQYNTIVQQIANLT